MSKDNFTFPIIIQARLSSKRLPNKVLEKINGKPLIKYLISRITSVFNSDQIILATSIEEDDDPLIDFCEQKPMCYPCHGWKFYSKPICEY